MNRLVLGLAAAASVTLSVTAFTAGDLALGRVTPALAQDAQGAAAGRQRMGKMLMSLGLSDAQKAQIKKIMADARAKSQSQDDRAAKRATMRAAFDQIKTVLTPAQQAKMAAEQAHYRATHPAPANHS